MLLPMNWVLRQSTSTSDETMSTLSVIDPRTLPDFNPRWLPLCDGREAPTGDRTRPILARVIEFASHYYAMNRAVALAEKCRRNGDSAGEAAALEELRRASHARDALEDRYAPEGFFAEPIMKGSRYANLIFTWANKPSPPIFTKRFKACLKF